MFPLNKAWLWRGAGRLLVAGGEGEEGEEARHSQELAQQQEQAHGNHFRTGFFFIMQSTCFTQF